MDLWILPWITILNKYRKINDLENEYNCSDFPANL